MGYSFSYTGAAVCAADGPLQVPKQAGGGVTLALAAKPFAPDWSWKNAEH